MARRPSRHPAGARAICPRRAAIAVRFGRTIGRFYQPPGAGAACPAGVRTASFPTPGIHDAAVSASGAHAIHTRAADVDDQGSPRVEAGRAD
jgi:hypothetical protein